MAKLNFGVSPTSVILRVKLLNSSVTTGAGLTGLVYNSTGLIISTIMIGEATATAYTTTGATIETIATLGTYAAPTATKCRFKEVDATNHPGIYEIQLADARFASTGSLIISISGATNLAQCDIEVQCSNLASNLIQILSTAVSTPATAGVLDINVKNIANAVVNTASAQIGSNVVSQANIDFGALQKTSLNAATPASIQGAVASVTGNVGGSVASVTGAVGSVTGNVTGSIGSLATQAKADVNAEVVDVLNTDANTELGSMPTTTSPLRQMVQFIFQYFRNKRTVTTTTEIAFKEDASTQLGSAALSDDGTTFTKGEMN